MTLHAPGASPLETRAAVQAESQGPARAATSRAIESRAALDALSSLSPAQHGALLALLQASQTRHAIEYRVSIPTLLWGPRDEAPLADGTRLRDSLCGTLATSKVLNSVSLSASPCVNTM